MNSLILIVFVRIILGVLFLTILYVVAKAFIYLLDGTLKFELQLLFENMFGKPNEFN